jgi:hypothetical protein
MGLQDLATRDDVTARSWLFQLERRIEHSLEDAAQCFEEIRSRQLYKLSHSTWAEYCRDRWGRGARRISQLIAAGLVVQDLRQAGVPAEELPRNERQARGLAGLAGEKLLETFRQQSPSTKRPADLVDRVLVHIVTLRRLLGQALADPGPAFVLVDRLRQLLPGDADNGTG